MVGAGEVGFRALLGERGKGKRGVAEKVESGGTPNFLEGLTEELFFAIGRIGLEEGEELALFRLACSDFWQSGHGIAAHFFRRIPKEGKEPLADGLLEDGLLRIGKAGPHRSNEGHPPSFFL